MPGNPRRIDPGDEILRRVAPQRRQRKARIPPEKTVRRGVYVGKVAPPPARDADLLARRLGVVDDQHLAAPPTGLDRGEHTGRAGPKDDDIGLLHGSP